MLRYKKIAAFVYLLLVINTVNAKPSKVLLWIETQNNL